MFVFHPIIYCFTALLSLLSLLPFSLKTHTLPAQPQTKDYLNTVELLAAKYNKQQLQTNSNVVIYMLNV